LLGLIHGPREFEGEEPDQVEEDGPADWLFSAAMNSLKASWVRRRAGLGTEGGGTEEALGILMFASAAAPVAVLDEEGSAFELAFGLVSV
jgi:hypothetical protein